MKFNMPNIDKLRADSTSNFGKIDYSNIKPVPIVPNQQKQIELMTDMVNKQSKIIKQQDELISLVQEEALAAAKQAKLAMILTLIGLVTGFIQIIPTLALWIEELLSLLKR
ncbi:hypothetical protein NE542_02750 [Faecalibacillus intestinalis]|jgi:hypothetical protein|uniref:Uncharacterized protein n=1 Tax=Faecalibacillus intestinalis TaxID=1982626 RepID=A0AAP2UD31_9FIRM|nr:hypothetical protein [Faecalibacillus intestinalis]MCB8591038.1 hypothetical protein [Faecalibacillus intestinalis]MCB8612117.1 hypothetical protein [Faecalibacillus intestinalis]MCG4679572.1 hypothetical protein [Faecalibacillus intestinalis]MCG4712501.1 hypothetical protein [Faecalibacillus intestinalis]MCG4753714.1 hypothetical protein [Faecalibacillus intestinalis]